MAESEENLCLYLGSERLNIQKLFDSTFEPELEESKYFNKTTVVISRTNLVCSSTKLTFSSQKFAVQ